MISSSMLSFLAPLKIAVFDKQPLALTMYSIDLELEGFETPEKSKLAVVSYRSVARGKDKDWGKKTII